MHKSAKPDMLALRCLLAAMAQPLTLAALVVQMNRRIAANRAFCEATAQHRRPKQPRSLVQDPEQRFV